jgi:hypothetical protein
LLRTTAYKRDSATGYTLINSTTGYPVSNSVLKDQGRTIPKHILGWGTRFRWKDLSFLMNWEYRGGNVMFSQIGRDMTFTGSGKWTENRDPQRVPNSGYVDASGKVVENTTINVRESEYAWWVSNYRLFAENFVNDAWFIKLRDVSLTYTLPAKTVSKTKILAV